MGLRKLKLQVYLTEFWSHFKYTKKARLIPNLTFWGCEDAGRYGIFNVSQYRYISHCKSNLYFCQVWRSFCLLSHSYSQRTGFYDCSSPVLAFVLLPTAPHVLCMWADVALSLFQARLVWHGIIPVVIGLLCCLSKQGCMTPVGFMLTVSHISIEEKLFHDNYLYSFITQREM